MAVLSKIKIGADTYDLKDADARGNITTLLGGHAVEALGAAAWKAVAATISGEGLVDASVVKAYVDSQVGQVHSFDVVIDAEGTAAGPSVTASADTMYKIYMVPDAQASAGTYVEWITIRSGAEDAYTYAWEKIGSTKTDLTDYVSKETTIANITLDHNITVAELQTALGLKALAYKDSAAGTVAGQTIKGVKATGTATGSISGALGYTETPVASTGKFTPAGNITGAAISGGDVEVTLKDATAATNAIVNTTEYTPAGSVSVAVTAHEGEGTPSITVIESVTAAKPTVTPAKETVATVTNSGTAYTITGGSVTKETDAKSTFATGGVVATLSETDAETLVFSAAPTAQAVTAAGDVTYTAPTLSGELPTFGTQQVLTGVEVGAPTITAPTKGFDIGGTFTGTAAAGMKVTSVTYTKQAIDKATFTGTGATLGFTGTEGDVSVSGNYDKADKGTIDFAGTEVEFAVGDIAVASKEVTVQ